MTNNVPAKNAGVDVGRCGYSDGPGGVPLCHAHATHAPIANAWPEQGTAQVDLCERHWWWFCLGRDEGERAFQRSQAHARASWDSARRA